MLGVVNKLKGPIFVLLDFFRGSAELTEVIIAFFAAAVVIFVVFPIHECAHALMAKALGDADKADDNELRRKALVQVFHMIRTAAVLLHPMAPKGTEMILEYLGLDKSFWSWDRIFDTIADFTNGEDKKLKFLAPRVDFFTKHESQLGTAEEN